MPKELIDEEFNKMLWRMNGIEIVTPEQEMKFRIAFQEGIIKATEYLMAKFERSNTI
jgi:hypothetical protein